jgi:hypothetical protein
MEPIYRVTLSPFSVRTTVKSENKYALFIHSVLSIVVTSRQY